MKQRHTVITMAVVLLLSATLASAGAAGEGAPADVIPVVTAIHSVATTPADENAVLQEIEARTGIRYVPVHVAGGDYITKFNSMIASRSVPDVFSVGTVADQEKYRENGLLLALDELLAQHGPNILADKGGVIRNGINAEGTIWGIPRPGWYPNNFAIRSDWLDNLGMELPTDLDSLYEVLRALTYDDPDGDGQQDTIGLGLYLSQRVCWGSIFAAFGIPAFYPIYQDGVVTSFLLHENYLDAIRYYRRLYREGLMEPDFATLTALPTFEKLWNGIYGSLDFTAVGTTNNWIGRYNEDPIPTFDFALIKGPEGHGGSLAMYGTEITSVNAASEAAEDAVKLMDYFHTDDGNQLLYFGIEGTYYRWLHKEAGKFEYLEPYNDSATQRTAGGWVYWGLHRRPERRLGDPDDEPADAGGIANGPRQHHRGRLHLRHPADPARPGHDAAGHRVRGAGDPDRDRGRPGGGVPALRRPLAAGGRRQLAGAGDGDLPARARPVGRAPRGTVRAYRASHRAASRPCWDSG